MAKKKTLVDVAKAETPVVKSRKSWFDKLPEDGRRQLLELREAFQGGELPEHTGASLRRLVVREFPEVSISENSFRRWMRDG